MDKGVFNQVLEDCPRVVPVFMVIEKCDCASQGEYVYWSWTMEMMSHRGPVKIKPSKLEFIGYAPIISLANHLWPNTAQLITMDT